MEPPAKKPRGLWSLQQLRSAMAAVKEGVSQRAAAVQYSIPRRTLVNHLKTGKVEKQIGRRTILTADQESDLVSRIKRLASVGFPLTPKVIRHQAFAFCEQHNIPNNFNKSTKRAGKDWLKLFLKRHSEISKRKVQILNPGRAQKLNKLIVMQHFEEYKKIYEELEISAHPQRLYNMDEKGCRLTIHNQPTVLAKKGTKRVHMVAPEHAENVTVAACVNALGYPIPPMILFKGKRLKPEFKDNLPAGSLVKMAPKGSMTTSLFVEFIHHLGRFKTTGKCLLVFDGASCHLDYQIVDAADEEDIVLYCLPSNTTHELQPLDKSVNKSFEHHWNEEVMLFRYQHPEKKITKARFNTIFSKVWSKCMTHDNIVSGFRATGLYPYDPDAIPVEAYAPSVLTERPAEQQHVSPGQSNQKSSIAGPSGIYSRRTVQSPSPANCSDSDKTLFEDQNSRSPSLLHQFSSLQPVSMSTGTNRGLVDYSATESETEKSDFLIEPSTSYPVITRPIIYNSESDISIDDTLILPQRRLPLKSNLSVEPSTSNAVIRRPIIYSSESDTYVDDTLILTQRRQTQSSSFNIYSSSEDENLDPLPRQERTPIKQIQIPSCHDIDAMRRGHDGSATSDDAEDDIPLGRLKAKKSLKSPFQQLIPTPNFAVVKQKPRRKAINYKARIVTKDLFTERDNKKEMQKIFEKIRIKESKQKGNEIESKKNPHPKTRSQKELKLGKEWKNDKGQRKQTRNTHLKTLKSKKNKSNQIGANDKWYCHACNTESFEDMRQCPICQRWFHEQCLGLTKEDVDFECPMCD